MLKFCTVETFLGEIKFISYSSKVMCVQYWPAAKELDETYGGITISVLDEEELAHFHIRTFRLSKKQGDVSIIKEKPSMK